MGDAPQDYVAFTRSPDEDISWSALGKQGGRQLIQIATGHNEGVVAHEIMHALGFHHEHQHPGASETIDIHPENVESEGENQFEEKDDAIQVQPYDPDSIMHYGTHSFSENGEPTIEVKEGVTLPEGVSLGQRNHLSAGDIASINEIYSAPENITSYGFDAQYYLEQNPDLQNAFGKIDYEALHTHWLEHGMQEGRIASREFDPGFYLSQNPDVAAAVGSENYQGAHEHWIQYGIQEGRSGSDQFDPQYYLNENPDVAAAVGSENYQGALDHWLQYGRDEGRFGSAHTAEEYNQLTQMLVRV